MSGVTGLSAIPTYAPDAPEYVDHSQSTEKLQENFFTMLTAQLEYQDPMKPMENAEFTNQMVGFYELQQQQAGNALLKDLVSAQQGDGLNQGVQYLGHLLTVEGDAMQMKDGIATAQFENSAPSIASVDIYNQGGQLVKSVAPRQYEAGTHQVDIFDPTLADGLYTFKVTPSAGETVTITTLESGYASGVVRENGVTRIRINDHTVDLEQIRQVDAGTTPASAPAAATPTVAATTPATPTTGQTAAAPAPDATDEEETAAGTV